MPKERTNFSYPASNFCSLSLWLCGSSRTVLLAPRGEYFLCVRISYAKQGETREGEREKLIMKQDFDYSLVFSRSQHTTTSTYVKL